MTSFEPIYNTYMPTAPCSRRAITQKHSFPVEEQHIVPDRRLIDDTQRSNDENIIDNDYNIDLPISYSISQMNTKEDSSLENKIWEDRIASPRIYDDDSSSIETILDPYTLILEDNKSNSDEQENFSMDNSYSSSVDYSIELSHPLIICDQDQSDSNYSDPEELEHGSSSYFLQQHRDIAGCRKQRYLSETEIDKDSENDDNIQPAKQRRTRSLLIDNKQTSSRHNNAEDHP
ncbi:predicted protein [Sclerotinia sclerotiorum 1980 UF-70]|uniref:Uncharacterized protein n=1 Tax=Sclerotinia sclerotiorum (strain ATCC 18683 / 1980 / Ss-1) TaxID=665079 RepID=A7EMU1_SCLS1|nr:predicted protein [Sclerotinia sclerotiorum 1980 UF-70]EDO04157.1 predicted protein [Sclerotinia sclerotiorum 1980 UF-70]